MELLEKPPSLTLPRIVAGEGMFWFPLPFFTGWTRVSVQG